MEMKRLGPGIIDRGRGPEIEGTRITVYDVMDYHPKYHHTYIASLFSLSSRQILEAIDYIEKHRPECEEAYTKILARHAKGNPPEVEAKLAQNRKKLEALKRELAEKKAHAQNSGGR